MPITLTGSSATQSVQTNLNKHNAQMNTSISKVTSGERVFRAEEDPAAVVSGVGMKTELAALGRARLNATNGISMLQVADGALGSMSDIASRMKTLAAQASSGQLNDNERTLINQEFQALKTEFDRIANDTEFNGVKLLTGAAAYTQNNAATPATDGVSKIAFDQDVIGDDPAIRYSYDSTTETLTATRIDAAASTSESIDISLLLNTVAGEDNNLGTGQTLNLNFNTIGTTITLGGTFDRTADILPTITDGSGADTTLTFTTGTGFVPATTDITEETVTNLAALATGYNAGTGALTLDVQTNGTNVTLGGIAGLKFGINGGGAGADGADSADIASGTTGSVEIYATTTGGDVLLGTLNTDSVTTSGTTNGTLSLNIGQGIVQATYDDDSGAKELTYVVGNGINNTEDQITVSIDSATVTSLNLNNAALVTAAGSAAAMQDMDNVIDGLTQIRANLGAQQSRLEFVARNIGTSIENTTIAKSDLLDVDISEEITTLTNSQAMYEASLAMMSRVNQQPEQLLQLLRDS